MRLLPLRLLVVTVGGLLSAGCAYARGIPIGDPVPARTPNCELSYTRIAPAEAQAQWRQVGDVCLSDFDPPDIDADYSPGEQRDQLTKQACALGGEMVTPIGLCANGKASAIEFGVYVRR